MDTGTHRGKTIRRHREDGYLQAEEKGLRRNRHTNTLISKCGLQNRQEINFCLVSDSICGILL